MQAAQDSQEKSGPTVPDVLEKIPAVVLAGGRLPDSVAASAGTDNKALLQFQGETLLFRVVQALRDSGIVSRLLVVGPPRQVEAEALRAGADAVLPELNSGPANMEVGFRALTDIAQNGRVLLAASDLPFVDVESVRWLFSQAPPEADVVYPVITRAAYERLAPGKPNKYVRMEGNEYTGGSLLIVRPSALLANLPLIRRLFAARKSQIGMARTLGLPLVLKFLLGKLTVADAETRLSQITGCVCRALLNADARLSVDIDTPADFDFLHGTF